MYICELVGKLSFPGGGGTHGRSSSKTLHPFPQFSPLIPRSEIDASPDTHDLSPKMGYPKKRQEVDDRGISVTALEPFVWYRRALSLSGPCRACCNGRYIVPRTTGYLLGFPATLFLVQSYWLYVVETRGAILSVPGPRATSRNILWSTTKVNEACARPPHVA
jgi:hypothetical protein